MTNNKICFVGTEITPSVGSTFVGGHVNTVVGLCKGLTNLGWEVHIITTPSRFLKDSNFSFPWANFHLIHASGPYNSIFYDLDYMLKAVKTVNDLCKKEHIEIVHGHSGYFGPSIIPTLVKKSLGICALFSLYCPASLLPSKLPLDAFGINALASGLDKVIAVTANVKESLTRCGVAAEKIEVLHSCFDQEAFNGFVARTNSEVSSVFKTQKVLFVGNADKTKGLDIFLKAAKSILRTAPKVVFIITLHEPGERLQSVRVAACQMLGSSVEVFGVVNNMAELMSSVDVVVAPFRSTSGISDIPIIVLEAMALGKPVIVSNLEGAKEAIKQGKNGIIIDLNVDELINAIKSLLENPALGERMGRQAIFDVKKFSYSEKAKQLSELYYTVME